MAAYNAELVKQGKEPLPIVAPSQAYLDALHSGKLEEKSPTPNWGLEEKLYTATLVIEQELEGLLAGTQFEGELNRLKLRLKEEVAGGQKLK